jgi:hypothetical protein
MSRLTAAVELEAERVVDGRVGKGRRRRIQSLPERLVLSAQFRVGGEWTERVVRREVGSFSIGGHVRDEPVEVVEAAVGIAAVRAAEDAGDPRLL